MVKLCKNFIWEDFIMAMIKCPECGKEISDKAEKCMNCGVELTDELKFAGYKLMQAKKEDHQYGLVAILFALLLPIVGLVLGIVGVVKKERFSVYAIFMSVLAFILYWYIYLQWFFG